MLADIDHLTGAPSSSLPECPRRQPGPVQYVIPARDDIAAGPFATRAPGMGASASDTRQWSFLDEDGLHSFHIVHEFAGKSLVADDFTHAKLPFLVLGDSVMSAQLGQKLVRCSLEPVTLQYTVTINDVLVTDYNNDMRKKCTVWFWDMVRVDVDELCVSCLSVGVVSPVLS